MKRTTKTISSLEIWGWQVSQDGRLTKGDKIIPRQLIPFLGQEREVRAYGKDEWLDVGTGFVWPEDAFVSEGIRQRGCTCGAKHTSLPDFHSSWCDNH